MRNGMEYGTEYGTEHGMTELTIFFGGHTSTFCTCKSLTLTVQHSQVYNQDFAIDLHTPWVAGSAKFHIILFQYHCATV